MCSYLGAEMVAVDAAKPRRRSKPILLATGTVALLALVLSGCDGVTVDLGSNTPGGKLTGNDAPIVEEITWIDVTADELIANYQQYIGKEVFVRNTVVTAKAIGSYVLVAGGAIRVEPTDLTYINYLAVTDTVEARGIVTGLNSNGQIVITEAHINVWFSCYPREHTGNEDVGNDRTVQSDTNGVPGGGWPGT